MQVLKDLNRYPSEKMLAAREIILEILEILLHLCRSRSPDLDPFYRGGGDPELLRLILLQTIGIAEDRPPHYGEKAGHCGGQAPALR